MISKIFCKVNKRLRVLLALRNAVADTESRLASKNIHKMLILCYGNIYRSPFVAQYLRNKMSDNLEIRSAGFYQKPHRSSPETHIKMCAEHQVDLSGHRSTVIDRKLAEWADAIVIMDKHNWYALADYGDNAVSKVVWLGALLDTRDCEIEDPYNKSADEKKVIINQLLTASDELIARLSQ